MILTEEQRAAIHAVSGLLTAIGCPQCHSYLQKNYTHHIEVLRAMTDSSEHFSDATKMIGFDMEKARASIAHYRIENPSNVDTESALKELVDQANLAEDALAEIERLLGEKAFLEKVVHIKNTRLKELEDELVKERTGAIRCESYNHCEGMYEIDLPNAIIRAQTELQAEGKIGPDADAKPREGLYGKYCISKADGSPVDPNADYFVLRLDTDPVARRAAREYSYVTPDRDLARGLQDSLAKYDPQLKDCMNIQFFGLEKPHCWQITEERKAALWHAINVLKENDIMEEPEEHLWDEGGYCPPSHDEGGGTMKIGDTVRVVGSSILGDMGHLGEVFTITAEVWGPPEKHFPFSPYDGSYFSESSLELEEAGQK